MSVARVASMTRSMLLLTAAFVLFGACFSGDEDDGPSTPATKVCPFTLPAADSTFPSASTPSIALLTFPTFDASVVTESGEDGKDPLYAVESLLRFPGSDGVPRYAPTITYFQPIATAATLLTPDEVAAEFDRREANARGPLFDATTSATTVTLGGEEVNVLVAKADASYIMHLFVPIDDGALFYTVSLGVYATVAGCEAQMSTVFEALKSGVRLNPNATFNDLEAIKEAKQRKLGQ